MINHKHKYACQHEALCTLCMVKEATSVIYIQGIKAISCIQRIPLTHVRFWSCTVYSSGVIIAQSLKNPTFTLNKKDHIALNFKGTSMCSIGIISLDYHPLAISTKRSKTTKSHEWITFLWLFRSMHTLPVSADKGPRSSNILFYCATFNCPRIPWFQAYTNNVKSFTQWEMAGWTVEREQFNITGIRVLLTNYCNNVVAWWLLTTAYPAHATDKQWYEVIPWKGAISLQVRQR